MLGFVQGVKDFLTQTIHGTGIFTYIYHKHKPNVGKYTCPMDDMGNTDQQVDPLGLVG